MKRKSSDSLHVNDAPKGVTTSRFKPYPKYKDSGVEWLGEIPDHWEVRRLKYLAQLVDERLYEPDGGLQFIGLENVESWTGKAVTEANDYKAEESLESTASVFRPGDILFGKLRPYLAKVLRPESSGICSTELLVLRPSDDLLTSFHFYIFLNRQLIEWVNSYTYGTKMPRVSPNQIKNLSIAIPPTIEQSSIFEFLDRETVKIDELVSRKERLLELLREKRVALINRVVTKGLDPNVPMKDSGIEWLGEIPKHWLLLSLKYLVRPRGGAIKTGPFGSQLLSSDMQASEIKVYNQRNVIEQDFVGGENYISLEKYTELKPFTIEPYDVVVTTRGTIGICAIAPSNLELGILHPCLLRIQPNAERLIPDFLKLLIQDSYLVRTQLLLASNATTIDVIYSDTMKTARLPIPPLSEQQVIVKYLKIETAKIDVLVDKIYQGISVLNEYRSALISAAVTGKIDVREARGE